MIRDHSTLRYLVSKTIVKPKGERAHIHVMTDATDDVIGSDDKVNEPVIAALGKRSRPGGLSKGADGEAERPYKNRVS